MDSSSLGFIPGYVNGYQNSTDISFSGTLSIAEMEAEMSYMPTPIPIPMPMPMSMPRPMNMPVDMAVPRLLPENSSDSLLRAMLHEPTTQISRPTSGCPQPLDHDRSRGSVILEDLMTNGIPSQQKQNSNNFNNKNNNNKRVWQACHVSGSGGSTRKLTWAGPTLLDIQSALALKKNSHFSMNDNNNNSFLGKSDGFNSSEIWKKLHKREPVEPKYTLKFKCESDALDDGYRWRKYGQKSIKNNPHPRSYYRCTHPKCPVKKQVERTLQEEMVVIIEGIHLHHRPNPIKTISMSTSMSTSTPSPMPSSKSIPLVNIEFPLPITTNRKPLDFLNPLTTLQGDGLLQDIITGGLRNTNEPPCLLKP